jgi:hypothetical protein
MKKIFLASALALGISASFVSCSKDDDKSATELLIQAGWKPVSIQADLGTGTFVNQPLEDCAKDDVLKFNADQTYKTTIGTNKCDPSETDVTGPWSLSADEKTITVDGDASQIETLNGSTLVIIESETFGGVTIRFRATMGH